MVEEDDIKYLLESLKDEDPHVRIFTINAIIENKDRNQAISELIRLLYDENSAVRERAAWGLGKIQCKESMEALILLLTDSNYDVRKNAVRALGEIMAFDAIPNVLLKLQDEHWEVRNEAALALEYLSWVPTNIDEQTLVLIAKEKWEQLLKMRNLPLNLMIKFLKDLDKDIRVNIAKILGKLKDKNSIQPLFDVFMTDTNFEVKETVASALSEIGGEKVVDLLQVALHDDNWIIRKNAATAIGNLKDTSSIKLLEKLLNDDNDFVRKSAEKAIQNLKKKI